MQSEAGLRKVNEMYVPEQLQAGFSDMIDEYVHFNDSARNSIMEKNDTRLHGCWNWKQNRIL